MGIGELIMMQVIFCRMEVSEYVCQKLNRMIVKEVSFSRDKLFSGIDTIANAVKSTLGARGMTVLIESENHVGGLTVTKDGVTVANSITLIDPTENLAVSMMRQAADKTASTAGDGTTTSIVIAQELIHKARKRVREGISMTEVIRGVRNASGGFTAT